MSTPLESSRSADPKTPVERTVLANGLTHRVLEWPGDPSRAVLLLHGYLDCSDSLVPLATDLARDGRHVIAPDFRGHGGTGWVPSGGYYHFPDYVADLDFVLRELAPSPSHPKLAVVAHSMGGSVATLWCGAFPDRVAALALLEGVGPPQAPPEASPDRMARWIDGLQRFTGTEGRAPKRMATLDEVVKRLRMTHGGAVSDELLARAATWLAKKHASGDGYAWRFDPLHQTVSPARFDAQSFEHFAKRITAPTLLVDGGESGFAFPGYSERAGWYPSGRTASIKDAGHMMHWTRPAELSALVSSFLGEHGR